MQRIMYQGKRLVPAIAVALLMVGATFSVSYAAELTLADAIDQAVVESPEVKVAAEKIQQSMYSLKEAEGGFYPQIDMTFKAGREYNSPASGRTRDEPLGKSLYTNSSDFTVGFNQLLYDGFKTQSEVDQRKVVLRGAYHRANVIRYKVAKDMAETFFDLHRFQQTLTSVNEFVDQLSELSGKIKLSEEEGDASRTMTKYVSSRLARAQQTLVQTENNYQDAQESFTFLTNADFDPSTTVVVPQFAPIVSLEHYKEMAEQFSPDILQKKADWDAAQYDVRKSSAEFLPTLSFTGDYNETHDSGGLTGQVRAGTLMLEMKYKIFDGGTRSAARKRYYSQLEEKELQVERARKKVGRDLRGAWQEIQAKLKELKLVNQELDDSFEVKELRRQEFEEGSGDLIKLVEAYERYYSAFSRKVVIDSDINKKRLEIEFLSGRPQLTGTTNLYPGGDDDPIEIEIPSPEGQKVITSANNQAEIDEEMPTETPIIEFGEGNTGEPTEGLWDSFSDRSMFESAAERAAQRKRIMAQKLIDNDPRPSLWEWVSKPFTSKPVQKKAQSSMPIDKAVTPFTIRPGTQKGVLEVIEIPFSDESTMEESILHMPSVPVTISKTTPESSGLLYESVSPQQDTIYEQGDEIILDLTP